jgi:alginate O-acetyltransferase complex protein AlgI
MAHLEDAVRPGFSRECYRLASVSAYLPSGAPVAALVAALVAATLLAALALSRLRPSPGSRGAAWLLALGATAVVERLTGGEPAGFRMLAIIGTLLYGMKAVVSVESVAAGEPRLGARPWLAFGALWPGMRPALFASLGAPRLPGAGELLLRGAVRLSIGAAFIAAARLAFAHTGSRWLATALALPGMSLVLHFGIFNVVAGAWRLLGVPASPLFRAPLRSRSLREFWGRRWNLAFSEMTAVAVYRPLKAATSTPVATSVAFVFSGLLHEAAISLPVLAGFGLPLAYFALHAIAMLIERRLAASGRAIDSVAGLGRAWTVAWLVIPLPILFHRPFLAGVVWPLLGIPGP